MLRVTCANRSVRQVSRANQPLNKKITAGSKLQCFLCFSNIEKNSNTWKIVRKGYQCINLVFVSRKVEDIECQATGKLRQYLRPSQRRFASQKRPTFFRVAWKVQINRRICHKTFFESAVAKCSTLYTKFWHKSTQKCHFVNATKTEFISHTDEFEVNSQRFLFYQKNWKNKGSRL